MRPALSFGVLVQRTLFFREQGLMRVAAPALLHPAPSSYLLPFAWGLLAFRYAWMVPNEDFGMDNEKTSLGGYLYLFKDETAKYYPVLGADSDE